MKGLLVAISGPSGSGKGTIIDLLRERLKVLTFVLSVTTRAPRPGEKDGEVYNFVSKAEFEKKIENGEFLEYAQVHDKEYYGVLRKPVEEALERGEVVVREMDVQGIESVKKIIPAKNLLTIFLKPENLNVLRSRIMKRSDLPEEEIERRMESAKKEMLLAPKFNYQFINYDDRIEHCYFDVEGAIFSRVEALHLPIDMKRL